MKFILFIKDDIAVAKARKKALDDIELGVYDSYEEISETDFNSIELPSKKIDGVWCKTDEYPIINYPEPIPETEETNTPVSKADKLIETLFKAGKLTEEEYNEIVKE